MGLSGTLVVIVVVALMAFSGERCDAISKRAACGQPCRRNDDGSTWGCTGACKCQTRTSPNGIALYGPGKCVPY
ncbi:hypothetical protein MTO96_040051 [Rhipicephalus appendiculatus]